jgi:hypothetical protein
MARTYNWGVNVFQDFLFTSMIHGADIAKKELQEDIYASFTNILDYINGNRLDSQHLDFEIREKNGYFKVVGNNLISALWLSGVFPQNPAKVIADNEYVTDDIKYGYKAKKRKLTQKITENKNG